MKKHTRWFVFLRLSGIAIFIVLLFKVNVKDIWINLKQVNLWYFTLAILFQAIMLLIKGSRWHVLRGENQKKDAILFNFGTFLESYAIGVFTPGRLGELVKSGYEESKQEKWQSALKIIAERGFDMGVFILVAGFSVLYYNLIPVSGLIALLIIIGGFLFVLLSFIVLSENFIIKKIRSHFSSGSTKPSDNKPRKFTLTLPQLLSVFGLSIVGNVATFLSCYLLARGVNLEGSFIYISGGVAVAGLLNLLPITIMGIGTREYSFLYLFSGSEQSLVLAFSFLMLLVIQIGGGIIAMVLGQIFIYIWKKRGIKQISSTRK